MTRLDDRMNDALIAAAKRVLGNADGPLDYRAITARVREEGLQWQPAGHMVKDAISRDIQNKGTASQFRQINPDTFTLALAEQHSAEQTQASSPEEFERLVATLLEQMGFQEVTMTPLGGDGGVDVRGTLVVAEAIRIRMAVQAKRWSGNVGRPVVQQLRGSLSAHEQGLIITTSDFTTGAKEEAERPDASPVALMNGDQLVRLLARHEVGGILNRLERVEAILRERSG